jgi:hypothetical protein
LNNLIPILVKEINQRKKDLKITERLIFLIILTLIKLIHILLKFFGL